MDIQGPADFQTAVANALGQLRRIGLSGYVEQCLRSIDTNIADGAPVGRPFVAFVRQPDGPNSPGGAHVRWPDPLWDQPYRLASVLVHESTHVFEYWSDQATWGDERGPIAAERTTLCSLLTLEAVQALTAGGNGTGFAAIAGTSAVQTVAPGA